MPKIIWLVIIFFEMMYFLKVNSCAVADNFKANDIRNNNVLFKDNEISLIVLAIVAILIVFFCFLFHFLTSCLRERRNFLENSIIRRAPPRFRDQRQILYQPQSKINQNYSGNNGNVATFLVIDKPVISHDDIKLHRNRIIHVKPATPPTSNTSLSNDIHQRHQRKAILGEDLAALATLKLTRDKCLGLRKARSEEKAITKLLFFDNHDDEEENEEKLNLTKNFERQSTSDTNYIKEFHQRPLDSIV